MRARLFDPIGPLWTRVLAPLVSAFGMLFGLIAPFSATAKGTIFFAAAAAFLVAPLVLGRRRQREVRLKLGPGYVDVTGAGVLNQRIRARSVTAASTTRTERGVALALKRDRRDDRPLILELDGEDDVKALRDALGIGYNGFGFLGWPTGLANSEVVLRVARVACALLAG